MMSGCLDSSMQVIHHRVTLNSLAGRPKLFGGARGAAMSNRKYERNDRRAHTLFGGGAEYWHSAM